MNHFGSHSVDGRWAALAPLTEACRPKGETPPRDLRRTVGAIFWRHANGAGWRAAPVGPGPRWRAARLFVRWAKLGVRPRLLEAAQAWGVELGMAFLDGTSIRARPKAAGAPERGTSRQRDRREALGRSRGGYGTKARAVTDGRDRAIAFAPAPRQTHGPPPAPGLLDRLPLRAAAGRGRPRPQLRRDPRADLVARSEAGGPDPQRSEEAAGACPDFIHNNRNRIERLRGRLKEWRAVATPHEKTAAGFPGVPCLAATADRLKP